MPGGLERPWRATPAVQFGSKFRVADLALPNCPNSGIRRSIISGHALRSVLFSSVRGHSHAGVLCPVLLPGAREERPMSLERAVVDRGCRIPDGTAFGADAQAGAQRVFRTESRVTLVTSAMPQRRVARAAQRGNAETRGRRAPACVGLASAAPTDTPQVGGNG